MLKLFLDTNILLDIVFDRRPLYASSSEVLSFIESKRASGFVNALTCANLFFLVQKQSSELKAREFLKFITRVFDIVLVDGRTIEQALEIQGDFEDQVQILSAQYIKADYIVTRNVKDFKGSQIPVITPEQLLALL